MSIINKIAKIGMADHLRIIRDNERTMARQAKVQEALAEQHLQINERQMNNGQAQTNAKRSDLLEDAVPSNIIVCDDYNYNEPPRPAAPAVQSPAAGLSRLAKWGIGAALATGLLGTGGIGFGLAQLFKPTQPAPTAPAPVNTNTRTGFNIDLEQAPTKGSP